MDGETYQHDRTVMETIFEAISDKKETDLARCLNQATVETVLKFESVYGISPLAWCLREGDMSHIGLMRVMLASGLYDCAMVDSKGQTLLAGLVRQYNDKEPFVRSVIMLEIDGVSNADACYRMMKHNSLELFKLFLALRCMNETQLFESLTHAFTKLSVKNFPLSTELRIFVQWKLAHFGYRFLAGECAEPTEDWKDHCDVIRKCWRAIAERYDTNHYEDIDDTLLHLLTVIHNHLYFFQYKPFLEHLPMHEMIFCLAIFLYNYKNLSTMYHFMVNKCLVIEFVRMISRQLGLVLHCVDEIKAQLVEILKQFQDRDIKMENTFLNESVEKIKSLQISKQDDVVNRFNVKIHSGTANNESLIKEMMRIIRKTDECWVTTKTAERRTYKEQFKADVMMQITRNLHRAKHPHDVANRINSELKRSNKSVVCMAEDIVASESFSMDHLLSGKDRRTVRKLKKCYTKMKQFYSMTKIHGHFTQVAQSDPEQSDIFLACLKRALTVFGEAMKNTKSTPNMPNKRVRQTLEQLLTSKLAEFNILHRNTYAKAFSLQRLSIADSLEKKILINLPNYMTVVRVMLLLLLILVAADIRRSFYGILYRCGTLAALRSLLLYVGKDDSLWTVQRDSFRAVQKYFANVSDLLMELTQTRVRQTPQFAHVMHQFNQQSAIIGELQAMLEADNEISYASIRKSCFACDDMSTIRRLLLSKIQLLNPNGLMNKISSTWDNYISQVSSITWLDPRLVTINPAVVTNKLQKVVMALISARNGEHIPYLQTLLSDLAWLDHVSDADRQELNEMLRPYYNNIFLLDNKWKALKVFGKKHNLSWDKNLEQKLVEKDRNYLQDLFDTRRSKLRSVLLDLGIHTVDDIMATMASISPCALAALEYIQLELSEMLTAVEHFGDNFYYLQHRIPMIHGKNYRNQLAHDALSYNLLTDSGDLKLLINAIILADTSVNLFVKDTPKPPPLNETKDNETRNKTIGWRFPTLTNMRQWVEEQRQLLAACETGDIKLIHTAIRAGGEIRSLFCYSPAPQYHSASLRDLPGVVHRFNRLDASALQLFNCYFYNFVDDFRLPQAMLERALMQNDFESLLVHFLSNPSNGMSVELFAWPQLVSSLPSDFFSTMPLEVKQKFMTFFLDFGNVVCARQILLDNIEDDDQGPLRHAFVRGIRSIAKLLLQKTSRVHSKTLELAIVVGWNDMLNEIAAKTELDFTAYMGILHNAIKVNNKEAVVYLLHHDSNHSTEALSSCYVTAAHYGRFDILQYLLTYNHLLQVSAPLSKALHQAALKNHTPCVRLLLDAGAAVDMIMSDYQSIGKNTLLLLVMFGQVRVLRKVKSIKREIYGELIEHPFTVAMRYKTASPKMIRALRLLGFDWLDSSKTLHELIPYGTTQPAWSTMWSEIDSRLSPAAVLGIDHWTLARKVLQRWKLIAFIEDNKMDQSSLYCAANAGDSDMLRRLIQRSRSMRKLDDEGVLRDIVFQMESKSVQLYTKHKTCDIVKCIDAMLNGIRTLPQSDETCWHESVVDVGVSVCCSVLAASYIPAPGNVEFQIRNTAELLENMQDVMTIVDSLFPEQSVVKATFSQRTRTVYFLRVGDMCCAYDILPSDAVIELSRTVNTTAMAGETVLHSEILNQCNLSTVQLLVEEGANPLLADDNQTAPIHLALQNSTKPEVALYLIDECFKRKLRNADGLTVLELTDGYGGNRIIHTAVQHGQQAVLERLLLHNIDVSVKNRFEQTAAHIAATVPLYNSFGIMNLLLSYEPTLLNMTDAQGFTPLFWAARTESVDALKSIISTYPDFSIPANRAAPIEAISLGHIEWLKIFLFAVYEKEMSCVTPTCKEDLVVLTLCCNNFRLTKELLEFELKHVLEESTALDLPRLEAILAGASIFDSADLEEKDESLTFLTVLRELVVEINSNLQ